MSVWKPEDIDVIGNSMEVRVAALRRDGTLQKPVTIWVVRVGNELFVRSWRGQQGAWFRDAQAQGRGRLWAGSVEREVCFVMETDPALNDQIDTVYRTKYRHFMQYVIPMISPEVRTTTLKLVPCS